MTNSNLAPPARPNDPTLPDSRANLRTAMVLLAREIAMELEEIPVILKRKQITEEQYEKISKNPFYARVLAAETEAWGNALNTEQRVRIQAAFMLEQSLPSYWVRLQDRNESLSSINEGVKTVAKLAGIGDRSPAFNEGQKFLININLGYGTEIKREVVPGEAQPLQIEAQTGTQIEGDLNVDSTPK